MIDWSEIKYFRRDEWRKDPDNVDERLVKLIDEVRHIAAVPIIIHVAWDDSGHAGKSYHYRNPAQAVDFHFAVDRIGNLLHPIEQFIILSMFPFGGIGFYPYWQPVAGWHVDIRSVAAVDKKQLWFRDDKQRYQYGSRAIATILLSMWQMEVQDE